MDRLLALLTGLLGLGTGIFIVLSLLEKPVWRLMWQPQAASVSDDEARTVHAILKRVIHLLPPTMVTTMGAASLVMVVLLVQGDVTAVGLAVAAVFFVQLGLIVARLRRDIEGVDGVPSDGDPSLVRRGLGRLALLHHRGLLMTATTLVAVVAAHSSLS